MNDEEEQEYRRREFLRQQEERERDRTVGLLIGLAILFLGTGAIGAWGFWIYLNDGVWPTLSLRTLFGWSFTNDMIGLQNIVNWLLDAWIGIYTISFGLLTILGANQD